MGNRHYNTKAVFIIQIATYHRHVCIYCILRCFLLSFILPIFVYIANSAKF